MCHESIYGKEKAKNFMAIKTLAIALNKWTMGSRAISISEDCDAARKLIISGQKFGCQSCLSTHPSSAKRNPLLKYGKENSKFGPILCDDCNSRMELEVEWPDKFKGAVYAAVEKWVKKHKRDTAKLLAPILD